MERVKVVIAAPLRAKPTDELVGRPRSAVARQLAGFQIAAYRLYRYEVTSEQRLTNSNSGFTHVISDSLFSIANNLRQSSGSAKANSALPWPAPSIPGRNPSFHAPQPVGTAMYCRPSML
jgi:hypothetical protein